MKDDKVEAPVERKSPRAWAIAKGLLRLTPQGSVDYRRHTPWEYEAACRLIRWPDPLLDPTFAITAQEFDSAIASVHTTSVPKTIQSAKG